MRLLFSKTFAEVTKILILFLGSTGLSKMKKEDA